MKGKKSIVLWTVPQDDIEWVLKLWVWRLGRERGGSVASSSSVRQQPPANHVKIFLFWNKQKESNKKHYMEKSLSELSVF